VHKKGMRAQLMDKAVLMSDCLPEKAFWCTDGTILRNISEVLHFVENTQDHLFQYHVNEDNNKNDFADWIREVFHEDELANDLEGVMDRKQYGNILRKYLRTQ
jgi:hypothetical protein